MCIIFYLIFLQKSPYHFLLLNILKTLGHGTECIIGSKVPGGRGRKGARTKMYLPNKTNFIFFYTLLLVDKFYFVLNVLNNAKLGFAPHPPLEKYPSLDKEMGFILRLRHLSVHSCKNSFFMNKPGVKDIMSLLQPTSNSVELCRNYEYDIYIVMYVLSVKFKH